MWIWHVFKLTLYYIHHVARLKYYLECLGNDGSTSSYVCKSILPKIGKIEKHKCSSKDSSEEALESKEKFVT